MAVVTGWNCLLRFGIIDHSNNAEQSCGGGGWLCVISVELSTVKEIVSTFPMENLGYFFYLSWYFILAQQPLCCRGGCQLGSSVSCS